MRGLSAIPNWERFRRYVSPRDLVQPFGVRKMFKGIVLKHPKFLSKTVLVLDNDVDEAFNLLNKMMAREGLTSIIRRTIRYEKPYLQRNRMALERSKAIYDEDMNRKIKFLMRKNRLDPFPGQF